MLSPLANGLGSFKPPYSSKPNKGVLTAKAPSKPSLAASRLEFDRLRNTLWYGRYSLLEVMKKKTSILTQSSWISPVGTSSQPPRPRNRRSGWPTPKTASRKTPDIQLLLSDETSSGQISNVTLKTRISLMNQTHLCRPSSGKIVPGSDWFASSPAGSYRSMTATIVNLRKSKKCETNPNSLEAWLCSATNRS